MRRIFVIPPVQRLNNPGARTALKIALGFTAAALAVAGRMVLSTHLHDAAPYALVFASVTAATVIGGWLSDAITLMLGQVLTWYFIVPPQFSFEVRDGPTGLGLITATVSAGCIVFIIAIYQREVARALKARDKAEQARELVVRELNHRVNNTLSVVQGIARSTFGDESRSQVQAFSGRLGALAAAHALLTQQERASADFGDVVLRSLSPFRNERADQFQIDGSDFLLPPRAAINLALAIHELATNAVKYGALSVPEGRVHIRWLAHESGDFEFSWKESGGPPVLEPNRRGFGTNLIGRGLARDIGAAVDLDFFPKGLDYRCKGG